MLNHDVTRPPTSPGDILRDEFLIGDMTANDLALKIGCDEVFLTDIINGRVRITEGLASRLAIALNTSVEFWLAAQSAVDQYESKKIKETTMSEGNISQLGPEGTTPAIKAPREFRYCTAFLVLSDEPLPTLPLAEGSIAFQSGLDLQEASKGEVEKIKETMIMETIVQVAKKVGKSIATSNVKIEVNNEKAPEPAKAPEAPSAGEQAQEAPKDPS